MTRRATPLLFHPTIEMVKLRCSKIGLPEREGEKFWLYYETIGWKVGKLPMKNWLTALQGWKLRWEERQVDQRNAQSNGTANDVKREINRWRKEK